MAEELRLGGFSGGGQIDGSTVFVTSGSVNTIETPSYLEAVSLPRTGMRGRIIHADGTKAYEASISFELYSGSKGLLSPTGLLERGKAHSFGMSDGYNEVKNSGGFVTSVSFSAASGGIISGNVSLVFPGQFTFSGVSTPFLGDEIPMGYWTSGGGKIADWNLSMSQDATPMYANKDETDPHYIKIGLVSYELTVTSYEEIKSGVQTMTNTQINIGTQEVTLTGSITSTGFDMSGGNSLGVYKYTFQSGSDTGKANTLVIA